MRKHREHRFDNSQTGGFMGTLSVFMQLWRVFQIIMKKFCTEFWAQFRGCVLYSSATYSRISTVCYSVRWHNLKAGDQGLKIKCSDFIIYFRTNKSSGGQVKFSGFLNPVTNR